MKKVKDKSLMFIQGNYLRELRRCHTDYTQAQVAECVGKIKTMGVRCRERKE